MSTSQTMRPKFFEGQYLGAEDLTAAVDYSRVQDARHLLGGHTWGIAIGLNLKEVTQPDGQIQVFIQPGYAWDGFGRPVVVLSPYAVPGDLFKSYVYDASVDDPDGRLVEVWLRYREAKTGQPAEGFAACDTGDQNSRILETFTVEVGERRNTSDRHDDITVAATPVEASQAFQAFDSSDPVIYDESIPHQTFPDSGSRPKWLIFLGYVRWKPSATAGQTGSYQATSAADRAAAVALRIPIGAVAGAIQAAEGVLRLKNRTTQPSGVSSSDLVWVEGDLRVDGDARLFGGQLDLRDAQGQDQGVPLSLERAGDNQSGGRQLRAEIGTAQAGANSFQIGPTVSGTYAPCMTVLDSGKVGIGTTTPGALLELNGGDLLLKATQEDPGDLIFQNSAGVQKGRVWSNPSAGAGLFLASAGSRPALAIDAGGRIGIGTTAPDRAVTVQGSPGTYLNIKADGGTEEVLIGADSNGAIVSAMTNHDLLLRAGSNSTKMTVKADGKVGIGTTAPARKLHVVGDRIRLENGSKTLDLRADGSAVDLHSDTDHLYLRSSSNHNLVLNPYGGDGQVAVGLETPACKLHVRDSINGDASEVASHVAVIENASTGNISIATASRRKALDDAAGIGLRERCQHLRKLNGRNPQQGLPPKGPLLADRRSQGRRRGQAPQPFERRIVPPAGGTLCRRVRQEAGQVSSPVLEAQDLGIGTFRGHLPGQRAGDACRPQRSQAVVIEVQVRVEVELEAVNEPEAGVLGRQGRPEQGR